MERISFALRLISYFAQSSLDPSGLDKWQLRSCSFFLAVEHVFPGGAWCLELSAQTLDALSAQPHVADVAVSVSAPKNTKIQKKIALPSKALFYLRDGFFC